MSLTKRIITAFASNRPDFKEICDILHSGLGTNKEVWYAFLNAFVRSLGKNQIISLEIAIAKVKNRMKEGGRW